MEMCMCICVYTCIFFHVCVCGTSVNWQGLPCHAPQVKVPFEVCKDSIPDDLYKSACIFSTEEAVKSCQAVGYPVMIKASWGGGGKGIRKVGHCALDLWSSFLLFMGEYFTFDMLWNRFIMMMKLERYLNKSRVKSLVLQYSLWKLLLRYNISVIPPPENKNHNSLSCFVYNLSVNTTIEVSAKVDA